MLQPNCLQVVREHAPSVYGAQAICRKTPATAIAQRSFSWFPVSIVLPSVLSSRQSSTAVNAGERPAPARNRLLQPKREDVFAKGVAEPGRRYSLFISISSGLGDALRNRLEDSLEPIRLNAAKNLPQKIRLRIARTASGVLALSTTLLQNVITCRKSTSHDSKRLAQLWVRRKRQDCFPVSRGMCEVLLRQVMTFWKESLTTPRLLRRFGYSQPKSSGGRFWQH